MKITPLPEAEPRPRRVAIGEFDGVHLGHREVIRGADTVLTFEPHPLVIIAPPAAPKLLTSLPVKADLVATLGVEELVVIPFDESFARREAREFLDHVLVETLNATHVSVGENFRFGHRAAGDPELLRSDARFETRVVPLVECEGEVVSSTHIRGLVVAGEVDVAARFLGAPFQMRRPVVSGDRRGRELGFPTANLVPDPAFVIPGHGVYACLAYPAGAEAPVAAAVNVGVRPMFDTGRGVLIEAYLIDFEEDLYGTELRLDYLRRLRGERTFATVEALIEQMALDVEEARAVANAFATVPRP
jgi:riboflavin kinase / FMN adenylyltransferase